MPSSITAEGNLRPSHANRLSRGFSHDDTLGDDQKRYSWREELEKFRHSRKPLGGVSHLIDAFSSGRSSTTLGSSTGERKVSSEDPTFTDMDSVKNRRRGSLQIQMEQGAMEQLTAVAERSERARNAVKLQRRKSTSAILPLSITEVKMPNIDEVANLNVSNVQLEESKINNANDKNDPEKAVTEKNEVEEEKEKVDGDVVEECEKSLTNGSAEEKHPPGNKGQAYLEKVNERKRTWDYFEINHPKAISDKKLEQLKAKYTRRKTEGVLVSQSKNEQKGEKESEKAEYSEKDVINEKEQKIEEEKKNMWKIPPPNRTISMPIIQGLSASLQRKKSLELAWDPLTGQSIPQSGERLTETVSDSGERLTETESVDSGRDSEGRKLSSSSTSEESSSSRKSSQRKSSHLGDILELGDRIIPDQCILECFIDPFTGQFITNEVIKSPEHNNKKNLRVSVSTAQECEEEVSRDEGVGSLPCTVPTTPTHSTNTAPNLGLQGEEDEEKEESLASLCPTDDGICTSGSETGRVRGSALSLASGGELEERSDLSAVCPGSVARGIERFQGEAAEI